MRRKRWRKRDRERRQKVSTRYDGPRPHICMKCTPHPGQTSGAEITQEYLNSKYLGSAVWELASLALEN